MGYTLRVQIVKSHGQEMVIAAPGHDAVFKFVTNGSCGVYAAFWGREIEPVLKALGWWWKVEESPNGKLSDAHKEGEPNV